MICADVREVPNVVGMMPFWYPLTTTLPGSTIDSRTYWAGVSPFPYLAAEAVRSSRSGPTVPVAPAGLNVWQPLQPADLNVAAVFISRF